MKHHLLQTLALLLAVLLLCPIFAMAAEPDEAPVDELPVDETPADPIPAGWAHDPLRFAVDNGLMSLANLAPERPATRAELAKMIVTLLDPTASAPLDGYTDVRPDAWYVPYLEKAVAMGALTGSGDSLSPDAPLTREQAFTILARTFGVTGGQAADLTAFSDYTGVSGWALSSLGALVRDGYLNGSGGKLRPKDSISRQELATVLYNLTNTVAPSASELPGEGRVTLVTADPSVSFKTIDSDLILSCKNGQSLTLQSLNVSGRLVIRGASSVTLYSVNAAQVALCDAMTLDLRSGTVGAVAVLRDGAAVSGSCETLYVAGDTDLTSGTVQNVVLCGGDLTTGWNTNCAGAQVLPNAAGTSLTVNGRMDTLELFAKDVHVTGTGRLNSAVVHKPGAVIETPDTEVTEALDQGVRGIAVAASFSKPDPSKPTATFTYTFSNVSTDFCAGSEIGVRYCTLQLLVDGKSVQTVRNVPLRDGASHAFRHTFTYKRDMKNEASIALRILCDGDETTDTRTIPLNNYSKEYYDSQNKALAKQVRTLEVEATVLYPTTLYSYSGLSGAIRTLPAGTVGIYDSYTGISGHLRLSDGSSGWVSLGAIRISTKNYVISDYSTEVKESFVNTKGYTSTTDLLVWISLKTQKVNVFTRKNGLWKLKKCFTVCTGKNSTPTIAGVFRYQYRVDVWDFGSYYVKRPMIFNGGHAFHSRTYVKATGGLLDPTIGSPASHGCIRMYDEDVNWLWDNMKVGTTVVVY